MRLKIFATIAALTFLGVSVWIGEDWFWNVVEKMGFTWTVLAFTGVVILPSLGTAYLSASLLNKDEVVKLESADQQPFITIVIACFNEEKVIYHTLMSIYNSEFYGHIQYIVTDDGSTDSTLHEVKRFEAYTQEDVRVVKSDTNNGKAHALNVALEFVETKIMITVDADTLLHKEALARLTSKFESNFYAAVAGALRVQNFNQNWITKLQYWDYMLGIASAKQAQGVYDTTLVAQGAFSAFNTNSVRSVGGWKETVGEDIVLSWDLLDYGCKIGHEKTAIAYTNVPTTYKEFFKQRRRWSRGLVEAFKQNIGILVRPGWHIPYVWYNLMFPYIDIAFLFVFIPGVLVAIFLGYTTMAGWPTLFLIPLGILMIMPIIVRQRKVNKELGTKFRLPFHTLLAYILFYQFLQPVATLSGYAMEIFNMKKKW
jgi:biofilm PGA synthesis N-glycosyltransferase PgaC